MFGRLSGGTFPVFYLNSVLFPLLIQGRFDRESPSKNSSRIKPAGNPLPRRFIQALPLQGKHYPRIGYQTLPYIALFSCSKWSRPYSVKLACSSCPPSSPSPSRLRPSRLPLPSIRPPHSPPLPRRKHFSGRRWPMMLERVEPWTIRSQILEGPKS